MRRKKYNNHKYVILAALFIIVNFFPLIAQPAFAQGLVPCGGPGQSPCTLCHLIIGFEGIFKWLRDILLVVSILFITLSGVIYMVSSGNKGLMDFAKKAISYSLMGFALFLLSWLIVASILTALGYNQAGSWSTFSCDTNQATGPTMPTNQNQNQNQTGTNNLTGQGCDGVVQNISAFSGSSYVYGANDCSSTTRQAYTAAGCQSPGGDSSDMYNNAQPLTDPSSIRAGDALVRPGHVGICLSNGCNQIMGASSALGIHPSSGSSMLNTPGVRVIKAANLCPNC
jgi:hypothetical protein